MTAEKELDRLIDQVSDSHEPIEIRGDHNVAVMVSSDDWRAIRETLHLLAVPGMRESIRDGLAVPIGDCSKEPGW